MIAITTLCISLTMLAQPPAKAQKFNRAPNAASQKQLAEGLQLLQKGDAEADAGQVNQAQFTYQAAMEKLLPGVRHKPFLHTVKRDETAREDLGKVLVDEWEKEVSPAEFQLDEATWKVLDLIPPEFDLKKAYIKLLTEEVAAFYDPKTKTMHLIREPEAKPDAKPKKPAGLLEMIMGRDEGFKKEEAQSVIAHELTHALDDQHFDLDAMTDATKDDDDATLALSALMEGEATLTMMAVGQADWTGSQIVSTPAEGLGRVMRWISPFLPMTGGETARKSPPVMYESLIFPYLQGLVFCASLTNQGGWAALDRAYENPPISTEQIMHPEKYQGPKSDWPQAVSLGEMKSPAGYKLLGQSVIGELTTKLLLGRFGGRNASEGWDGDTLAVFQSEKEKSKFACIWMSTWDSPLDAQEFATAIAKRWESDGANLTVEQRGSDVLVIRGFDNETRQNAAKTAWLGARKTEKKFNWAEARAKAARDRAKK